MLISSGINGIERTYAIDSVSQSWYAQFSSALEAKDTVKAARTFTKFWGEGMKAKGDSFSKEASYYVFNTTLQTLREHRLISWPHLENHPPAMEKLSGIQLPVLILHADQDLPIIETASKHLGKTIRGARRILIKDAAHMLNLEKPDEVNRLLLDFLK